MDFIFEPGDVDQVAPLIYLWLLDYPDGRQSRYIGKAKGGAKRPLKHYRRNIVNMRSGRPYRKGNPDGWRMVHIAMNDCIDAGGQLTLRLVANATHDSLLESERLYIQKFDADLNGGGV